MPIAFVNRAPSDQEMEKFRLFMSVYTDGFGYEKNKDGTTRPGWRDFERIVAEALNGDAPEGKAIFDVIVEDEVQQKYGISVKSKGFTNNKFAELLSDGRVYMELCNSPAKLWEPLKEQGINEQSFTAQEFATEIGESILDTVHSWYEHSQIENIVLDSSRHLTVSYTNQANSNNTNIRYQLHSFALDFPEGIIWRYKSTKCLSGYDPDYPEEVLFDWYGLSGGQLKYYPRAEKALYSSPQFALELAPIMSISDRVRQYWPDTQHTSDEDSSQRE